MAPARARSSYALQQLVRAFNANATSWIGLVTFLHRRRARAARPGHLAVRPARAGHPGAAAGSLGGALVRHRFLRTRHPLPPALGRPPVAGHQHGLDPRRDGDRRHHRHRLRLCRRPLRHGGHAGDGRAALVPVADHGADGRGDARRQHGQPDDRHRADRDRALRAHRAGADDPGQGARLHRGLPRARVLRPAHHDHPHPAQHRRRDPGHGVAVAGDRDPHRGLAQLHRAGRAGRRRRPGAA